MIQSFVPTLKKNWQSGLSVALVSIPLAISLAVASKVSPLAGIITAIWAGFIGAAFGGSNYNIIGPTGALSGIIASYALSNGAQYVPMLAIVSGVFILISFIGKFERYLILVPSSVIHGFTLGVAGIIGLNQLNFALGLQNLPQHEKFIENVIESFNHINEISIITFCIFLIFLGAHFLARRLLPSFPATVLLTPFGIALGFASTREALPFTLETLASKFGTISLHLAQAPTFVLNKALISSALVVAFVAIIETILSAKIADSMTKTKHDSRKELFGLGLANIVSGLLGGIPATAALARTALNVKTGATSNVSAMVSSFFIGIGSFFFLPYFSYLPLAVIAAILVFVAINMIERENFARLLHHDRNNFIISLLVAAITIYEDPIMGILAGSVMALLLLINRLAQSYYEVTVHETKAEAQQELSNAHTNNILVYRFKGKLVYLNSQGHLQRFKTDFSDYSGIILVLSDLYFIDLDGVDALGDIIELIQSRGQVAILVQPTMHINHMLESNTKYRELEDAGFIAPSLTAALQTFQASKDLQ